MKYCEKCNKNFEDNKKFCVTCGSPLIEVLEVNEESKIQTKNAGERFCKQCGQKLPEGVRFCIKCGAPTAQDAPTPTPAPAPAPQISHGPASVPAQTSNDSGAKTALIIVAIVLGAIILFAVAFFATEYFAFGQSPMDLYRVYILGEDTEEDSDIEDDEENPEDTEDMEETEDEDIDDSEADEMAAVIEEATETVAPAEPVVDTTPTPTPTPLPTPEPTPTPWPVWNINANEIQRRIDDDVKSVKNNKNHYKRVKAEDGDVVLYTQSDVPVILDASEIMFDWNFSREYIGSGIYYVEVLDGRTVMERYYYEEGKLFRVVDMMSGYVHDYGEPGWDYYDEIGERLKDERSRLMEYVQ